LYELKKQKQGAEKEKRDKQNELNEMVAKWQKAKLAGVSTIILHYENIYINLCLLSLEI